VRLARFARKASARRGSRAAPRLGVPEAERAALGVAADREALARVDHGAAELDDPRDRLLEVGDLEVGERDAIAGSGAALVAAELEPLADAGAEVRQPEQAAGGHPADRHDQAGPEQPQLPLAPEGAERLLPRRRRPVAAAGRRLARIAAGDRGAVERRVEGLL